jgi:ABC-2 type transport system ATP-binding protein
MVLSDATLINSPALELRQVEKTYGDLPVLRGLDMTVNEGEIYGFLGRNGAGKSTALRIIMGVTQANAGEIHLFDESVRDADPLPRQQIGYVAQEQHFYGWMTALRIGRFVSGFYPTWDEADYRHLLHALEVPTDRKIDGFSGGMTAKLALCLALASKPKLLLLDEPTAGMDAVARREFLALVRDEAVRAHRTILFSSHLIDEVELAADKVGILDEGVMRFEGSLTELQQTVKRYIRKAGSRTPEELPVLGAQVLNDRVYDDRRELIVQFSATTPTPQRSEMFANHNGWRVEQPSLEDIFIAMVGKTFEL